MYDNKERAIELVIFRSKTDYSKEEVRMSLESLNPVLATYKGFLKRQLALNENDHWMDLVFWETMEDARFAADNIMKQEQAIKAFDVIDEKEMQFFHFTPVSDFSINEQISADEV